MMPRNSSQTRKISVDIPLNIWQRYEELGRSYGMKIKEFVMGAFEAADFLDKFLSETLTEEQIRNISPLLRNQLEKYETLYCGKSRSRNLDKEHVVYFDKHNEVPQNSDILIRTHDVVQEFQKQDRFSLDLISARDEQRKKVLDELILR